MANCIEGVLVSKRGKAEVCVTPHIDVITPLPVGDSISFQPNQGLGFTTGARQRFERVDDPIQRDEETQEPIPHEDHPEYSIIYDAEGNPYYAKLVTDAFIYNREYDQERGIILGTFGVQVGVGARFIFSGNNQQRLVSLAPAPAVGATTQEEKPRIEYQGRLTARLFYDGGRLSANARVPDPMGSGDLVSQVDMNVPDAEKQYSMSHHQIGGLLEISGQAAVRQGAYRWNPVNKTEATYNFANDQLAYRTVFFPIGWYINGGLGVATDGAANGNHGFYDVGAPQIRSSQTSNGHFVHAFIRGAAGVILPGGLRVGVRMDSKFLPASYLPDTFETVEGHSLRVSGFAGHDTAELDPVEFNVQRTVPLALALELGWQPADSFLQIRQEALYQSRQENKLIVQKIGKVTFATPPTPAATTTSDASTSPPTSKSPLEEPTPPVRKDDPQVVDPKPVPAPTTDPEVQAIIDDIGPWDPEKIEYLLWGEWEYFIWSKKYKITIPFNKEDGMEVIMRNSAGSNYDLELNLDAPQFKPLIDFLEREYTNSRIQTLAKQQYTICRKSLGGKLDEDFVIKYTSDKEGKTKGKTRGVIKTFASGQHKASIVWTPTDIGSYLYCDNVPLPNSTLTEDLAFRTELGSDLHTQYIKPFEDELRPYLEQEQARQATQATPEPEPTPEAPAPSVRKDDPQVVDPKPVSEPAPSAVTPPRITSQEVTSQTFDDRNIMSGRIEIVLDGALEKGVKVVGQNGKEKAFVEKRTLGTSYIGEITHTEQLAYTIVIDFSSVRSSWTYTLYNKATGQEIGKVTVTNPRKVKPETKKLEVEKDFDPMEK